MSNDDLLATIDNKTTVLGISNNELSEYVLEQVKASYVKPKRIDGRPLLGKEEFEKEFKAPVGLFNLGNNSLYMREEKKEEEVDEEIEVKNNVKMVDGKLVFTEEEQKVDAEEEEYAYNIALKNDLPWQIYMKIREFGRLTENELKEMYGALDERMLAIIIKDMLHKRYLKKVVEKDKNMVFRDIPNCTDVQEYMNKCIVETEITTLEITSVTERRSILT